MTARAEWLRLQGKKRQAASWTITVLAYALVFGLVLLIQGRQVDELADSVGPVMVRLGSPEGINSPLASQIVQGESAKQPGPVAQKTESAPPPAASPAAKKTEQSAVPVPAEKQPAASDHEVPALPNQPAQTAQPSAAASSAVSTSKPVGPESRDTGPVIAKGSEAGNSYSATVGGAAGQVARSLYIPIYRYMPVPMYVDKAVADRVMDPSSSSFTPVDERIKLLKDNYVRDGDSWSLKNPLPINRRERLWTLLEEAGYPIARADYKEGKVLSPVIIVFTVTPGTGNGNPTLTDVKIVQTCGYADIDEAVLYGFKQAVFSSSAKKPVTGKFTYRFNR